MTRTASHEWQEFGSYVEWCSICGAVRVTQYIEGQGDMRRVYFPYAYEGISKTTCAKAREKRDANGRSPVRAEATRVDGSDAVGAGGRELRVPAALGRRDAG